MRQCSNGHDVADGFQFCPMCGERVEAPAEAESPEPAPTAQAAPDLVPSANVAASAAFGETPEPPAGSRRKWPLSVAWTFVVGILTALIGLLVPLAIFFWRGGHRVAAGVSAGLFALIAVGLVAAIAGGGGGGSSTAAKTLSGLTTVQTPTPVAARACSTYKGTKKPQTCIAKSGSACSSYTYSAKPTDCFTAPQLRARVAARKAHLLAVAKARQRAAAQARERAAAIAAANAWHKGYYDQDGNVYWKWVNGASCQDFAQNGCWHVAVITRDGCASYVGVNANEYQGGSIVGSLLDNQGYGIPAKTERVFELDADTDNVTANNVTIDCN